MIQLGVSFFFFLTQLFQPIVCWAHPFKNFELDLPVGQELGICAGHQEEHAVAWLELWCWDRQLKIVSVLLVLFPCVVSQEAMAHHLWGLFRKRTSNGVKPVGTCGVLWTTNRT